MKANGIFQFEVRVGDINYGNHMGNDKALLIFQDARIKFLNSLGFTEKNIGNNTGIILNEAHQFYKKEVFLYDRLSVDVEIKNVTASSFMLEYTVNRLQDNVVVITGSTRIIAFNYNINRVARLPEEFLSQIKTL